MQNSYNSVIEDLELQTECEQAYGNYEELVDCTAVIARDHLHDVSVSSSCDHVVWRVDVYKLSEQYFDQSNQCDINDSKLVKQFYLNDQDQMLEYVNDIIKESLA